LVGTFRQPAFVSAELKSLVTLPDIQWKNGYAEIAKAALISGSEDWDWLSERARQLASQAQPETEYLELVQEALVRAVGLKARLVSADPLESGVRIFLNYGHSFAHALETVSNHSIDHGLAVAEGIRFASRLAVEAIGADPDFADRQGAILDALGLEAMQISFTADELFAAMLGDKKNDSRGLRMVFASAPGEMEVKRIDPDLLKIYLLYWEEAHS
ncbi:MAG: hypothetical protein LBH87_03145, partial [Coriobacteriales bacterium]|nr:hypothetical protein [Coriobacteriales bacterium]